MNEHVDNMGWATFGTTVGVITAATQVTQFATAMFTLISGIIVAHFLKRYLNSRFPQKVSKDKQVEE